MSVFLLLRTSIHALPLSYTSSSHRALRATRSLSLIGPRHRRRHRPGSTYFQRSHEFSSAATSSLLAYRDEMASGEIPSRRSDDLDNNDVGSSSIPEYCFPVTADFEPTGDQPQAIQQLIQRLEEHNKFAVLQGSTGTGKTFVMSHIIARRGQPTLVLCHNKTLAAQLARELRSFLGQHAAVELFVSFYNHYIPESYNEVSGRYTAKKSSINAEIDAMRHRATRALLAHDGVVVVVASVSCIYGLGLPKDYLDMSLSLQVDDLYLSRDEMASQLDSLLFQAESSDDNFGRGSYQVQHIHSSRTDVLLWPPQENFPMRIILEREEGTNMTSLSTQSDGSNAASLDPPASEKEEKWRIKSILPGAKDGHLPSVSSIRIFPAKHHVLSEDRMEDACIAIEEELQQRSKQLIQEGKLEESSRLSKRVMNDLLMLRETGFCSGVENYSRHLTGRSPGERPYTLIDYLGLNGGRDWLLMMDESHVTLPQLKAMYKADRARKEKLIKHGYRLPSALDNRPLKDFEFWDQVRQTVFVSATPSQRELEWAEQQPVEMIIRPTFICDPLIEVRPANEQLQDLVQQVQARIAKQERSLAVAVSKRDAEDLSQYLNEHNVSSTYIHSGLTTHERAEALKALQSGEVECLVGVNLLREGLDLPQVSLVAILNADYEGFLRSHTSLLQTVGRAARHVSGKAIFYANSITNSMQKCMDDTASRRSRQLAHNEKFGFTMKSTKGSSMMSIFDLSKDQIAAEQPLEVVGRPEQQSTRETNDSAETNIFPDVTVHVSGPLNEVVTDHVPSTPGVYFWKDINDNILYIGKAKKLRARVKSYLLPGAKHSARIKVMMNKAKSIDFILTESDRDALLLESNLIKHHQPPYNVLMKDDESYPYICASVGDAFPRFFATPQRHAGERGSRYRYFGPYPHYREINSILEGIETKYDLRAKSFLARNGSGDREEYNRHFQQVMAEVFTSNVENSLARRRAEYEEAGILFDSTEGKQQSIDVVALAKVPEADNTSAVVHLVQLRDGLVAGRFSYSCELPCGMTNDEDYASAIHSVLERRHYPSGEESADSSSSYFPNQIIAQYLSSDHTPDLLQAIREARRKVEPRRKDRIVLKTATATGAAESSRIVMNQEADFRALELAITNAEQVAYERGLASSTAAKRVTKTSVDGTALEELQSLLNLGKLPLNIECYDISHTQGEFPVGSRVVFRHGQPAPHLYRKFNIKTVEGVDDYASLEEVLERRFKRARVNNIINAASGDCNNDESNPMPEDDPWTLPDVVVIDGGLGQLGAAIKGMEKAGISPRKTATSPLSSSTPTIQEFPVPSSVAICALAKNLEEVFVDGNSEPVNDAPDSSALLLLRALRDESHRFALKSHRKRRSVLKTGRD